MDFKMSLIPAIRGKFLFATRNIYRYSPVFGLTEPFTNDDLGKYLTYSTHPNCKIYNSIVTALEDIDVGTKLSINPYAVRLKRIDVDIGETFENS